MAAPIAEPRTRPISVDEYHRMADAGIFGPTERVELLNGRIIEMPPQNPPHAHSVGTTMMIFVRQFGDRVLVRSQLPLELDLYSEPQPDLALLRRADYSGAHPTAADVLLVVEVSDTTIRFDRGRKLAAYATAGIAEYWIVDVQRRVVEAYADPTDGRFGTTRTVPDGESIACRAFPDEPIAVADMLPTRRPM
jgi:Uma2 family endonuclease